MSLPLTVIGGYLGAGKTTLINRLLGEEHGLRLLVMVNDFGAINVDAALIEAADDDMIALTNGCVCCTMGADLFHAIGDVLDRDVLPDHLIVEASGIADPAAIARVAIAEPDLAYGGIVTVVDALEYDRLSGDPQIGAQIRAQVVAADIVLVSKTETGGWPEALDVKAVAVSELSEVAPLLCCIYLRSHAVIETQHPSYQYWYARTERAMAREDLVALLLARPSGLFRVKGFVPALSGGIWQVQCVGQHVAVLQGQGPSGLVGIGLSGSFDLGDVENWWQGNDL